MDSDAAPLPKSSRLGTPPGDAGQPFACVICTLAAPIVNVPIRWGPVCAGTEIVTVPLPATLTGRTVIQAASVATG